MWYGGICRETRKFCQYATSNGGYCSMTTCINYSSAEIITYPWMVEKPKEGEREQPKPNEKQGIDLDVQSQF